MKESIHTHFIITSLLLLFNLLSIALAQHAVPTATATVSRDMRASQTAAVSLGKSSTTEEPKTGIIDKAISSHDQSTTCELTATRTTHEETSIPASTLTSTSTSTSTLTSSKISSSESETNKPVELPTPRPSSELSTSSSVKTSSATSSSAPKSSTSPSNDNIATAVKVPGLELTPALALVRMAVIGL